MSCAYYFENFRSLEVSVIMEHVPAECVCLAQKSSRNATLSKLQRITVVLILANAPYILCTSDKFVMARAGGFRNTARKFIYG